MPMRQSLIVAAVFCAIVPALAQDAPDSAAAQKDMPATAVYSVIPDTPVLFGSRLIGARVVGADNESVGRVANLIVNEDGTVEAAVIAIGGFLGVGERQVAVTYKSLKIARNAAGDAIDHVDIAATKNDLRYAITFRPKYVQQQAARFAAR
jgi:hypothetical protein